MLAIDEFVWLPEIIEKLAVKHQVSPDEVEEVFFNRPRFRFHEKGRIRGEDMYSVLGQSNAGRYLVVFLILKPTHTALIISARDMEPAEKRRYERK